MPAVNVTLVAFLLATAEPPAQLLPASGAQPASPQVVSPFVLPAPVPSQLDPALDSDSEEGPPDFTPGPASRERRPLAPLTKPDIASYFADGALKRARAAYDKGSYSEVKELLRNEGNGLPVRYLRVMAAVRLKDDAFAADELSALANDWPALRDFFLVEAARSYERLSGLEEACEHYAAVDPASRLYPAAQLALARVLERRKRIPAARETLEKLIAAATEGELASRATLRLQKDTFLPAARLHLADLAKKAGDTKAEQAALLAVWAMHLDASINKIAATRLKKVVIPPEWKVARAESLISLHRNKDGMKLLKEIQGPPLPNELTCRTQLALGMALRKERQHREALDVLRPVVAQCAPGPLKARALYILGYSESVVDPEAAALTYRRLAADYPEHTYADDALFYAAQVHVRLGKPEQAIADLERIEHHYSKGDQVAEGLFKLFWIRRARGELGKGLSPLSKIEALAGLGATHEQVQRARYWRARSLDALGQTSEAKELLARVADEGVATYYGLVARSRLAQLGAAPPPPSAERTGNAAGAMGPVAVWPLDAGPLVKNAQFRTGLELLRLGLPTAALELSMVERKGLPEESIRLLFHLLMEGGHETQASTLARSFLREGLSAPTRAETQILYTAAYPYAPIRSMVEKYARAAQVEPDLMLALIREESGFNPKARSSTGALGLAQLMPKTAAQVARSLKAPRVTARSLLDPERNVRLGSAYLGDLQRKFSGNPAHAVASYNAGPAAVNRWIQKEPSWELDEWVEEIPIDETRGYVKRVLGSYATYRFLYDTKPPALLSLGANPGASR